MKKNDIKIDFFGDGTRIFLDYISRQLLKNPNYKPHPIIRAFECALEGLEKCKTGQKTMGVSQEGTENNIHQPYIVVLEKKENGIEVKSILNAMVKKELPVDIMIIIFRLQVHLDKISGDCVNPQQMVNSLNAVVPGDNFFALGNRWKEARDLFRNDLKDGKIKLSRQSFSEEEEKELLSITYDTPWEKYSPGLRSLIGSSIARTFKDGKGKVVITSPMDSKIEKYKVFDSLVEFVLGKSGEYLNLLNQKNPPKKE